MVVHSGNFLWWWLDKRVLSWVYRCDFRAEFEILAAKTFSIKGVFSTLSIITVPLWRESLCSVWPFIYCSDECNYVDCHHVECHLAKCRHAGSREPWKRFVALNKSCTILNIFCTHIYNCNYSHEHTKII